MARSVPATRPLGRLKLVRGGDVARLNVKALDAIFSTEDVQVHHMVLAPGDVAVLLVQGVGRFDFQPLSPSQ